MRFRATNPVTELLEIINANNSNFKITDPDQIIVYKNEFGSFNGKNTKITFYCREGSGIKGISTVTYDRVELGKLFNTFGGKTVYPILMMNGNEGDAFTTDSIIAMLNAKLGITASIDAKFRDFKNSSYTLPAKLGKKTIIVDTPTYVDASTPGSLRFAPYSTAITRRLYIDVYNGGKNINTTAAVRSIYPLKNTSNALMTKSPVTAPDVLESTTKPLLGAVMYQEDFSAAYEGVTLTSTLLGTKWVSSGRYLAQLKEPYLAQLNYWLALRGYPTLKSPYKWYTSSNNANVSWNTLSKATSAVSDAAVNKGYNRVLVIPVAMLDGTENWQMGTHMYIHFNQSFVS